MRIHYLLAVTAMVALAYHTWDQGSESRWQVIGAGALWILLSFVAVSHAVFVQQRWSAGRPAVTIRPFHDLLRMDITVSPHWRIRPGQYVYLWLPHAGFRSCFQLQPFYVAYWDDPPESRILYVLTRTQASSLSTQLYLREWLHQRRQPALLLGPCGRSIDFSLFGTIVFIVEDIGILRMLPYIRMLVQDSEQRRAMVRKLKIVWQMQDFDHQYWLGDWMQEFLDLDRGEFKILEFRLYYLTKGPSVNPGEGFGERIKLCQGPLMAREIVQGHLSKRRGKLAVGVCARQSMRQQVRDVVQPRTGPDIKLFDFDPRQVMPGRLLVAKRTLQPLRAQVTFSSGLPLSYLKVTENNVSSSMPRTQRFSLRAADPMWQWHPSLLLVFPIQSNSYTPNTDRTDFQLPRLLVGERSTRLRGRTPFPQ
ncbi:NADPH oxidase family protein [Aspergillus luchuensis]|uniref:FAD-binding FR-type domain-containing protein n=1 Tax=Aspergillus kawachii TaxID=1069201 RepID=A0A7R7WBX7_ASPKA|nr:uncharacterized protein AKAW2_50435A [Aspergillus luchuensis]BCS00094.1 hypothetical protein AKAW2_50435A [Aspergillus luchuensis]